MEVKDAVQKPNVLVFAPERAGLTGERSQFDGRNFNISYEPLDTKRRLDEYDGVVVFQRTFENLAYKTGSWNSYWEHFVYQDDLDRRTKETKLLLNKGGFVCFVLCHPLVDRDGSRSFETTDLVKRYLRGPMFSRHDFGSRTVNVRSSISEFGRFIDLFGAAHSYFQYYANDVSELEIRRLATAAGHTVGMIFGSQIVFIPSMIPKWSEDTEQEYFELLVDAVVATLRKLKIEVPAWARDLKFEEEVELAARKQDLLQEIASIDERTGVMDRMKKVLIADGATLVEEVKFVLEQGLNFQTEVIEDFKEDLKLLSDDRSKVLALCEVKGMNRGVKREHINQADSHRERANLPGDFPTLLIANTGIKSARSVEEKNQPIDSEQIRHATQIHVLVLRSIDLLYLTKLQLSGRISKDQVRELFLREVGWLKVNEDGWSVQAS